MKYRIKVRDSSTYPFAVEVGKDKKFLSLKWTFWQMTDVFRSIDEAKEQIRYYTRNPDSVIPKVGTVVFNYDESDLVVDKLKGKA
jgi:hypothetical protein